MSNLSKDDILEAVANMSVVDVCDLVKMMEEKFDVSAAAPVMMGAPAGAASEASAEEKTEFDVVLESFGANKIAVIKAVRELTGLGLKEAKVLVESAPAPLKEGVDKDTAEKIKKTLEEAGAEIEIK